MIFWYFSSNSDIKYSLLLNFVKISRKSIQKLVFSILGRSHFLVHKAGFKDPDPDPLRLIRIHNTGKNREQEYESVVLFIWQKCLDWANPQWLPSNPRTDHVLAMHLVVLRESSDPQRTSSATQACKSLGEVRSRGDGVPPSGCWREREQTNLGVFW